MQWIVQRFEGTHRVNDLDGDLIEYGKQWIDIRPRDVSAKAWEAADAGHAFKLAVLENDRYRMHSTSYRILPFDGGATFDLSLNVEGHEHDPQQATPFVPEWAP